MSKKTLSFKKNILLAPFTTFKIGGKADYFFQAKTKEDLIKALLMAKEKKLPFFILGGGSNLLVGDKGYGGIIIKIQISKSKIQNNKIYVEAGTKLSDLVKTIAEKSLTGLEWAAGIPGTVGGAIFGNAGAFGKRMSDNLISVEVLDGKSLAIKEIKNNKCFFGNKDSVFKKNKNLIILSAIFKLKKGDKQKIKKEIKTNIAFRKNRHPLDFPSAGCIFKNSQFPIPNFQLRKKYPELEEFNRKKFIPASWLIEKSGLKSIRVGGAEVSEKHANFVINKKKAKAADVLKLISVIKREVKKKFGILLEEEVQILR
jgi:UDP-N-acetylmuramate dehydrogenase